MNPSGMSDSQFHTPFFSRINNISMFSLLKFDSFIVVVYGFLHANTAGVIVYTLIK